MKRLSPRFEVDGGYAPGGAVAPTDLNLSANEGRVPEGLVQQLNWEEISKYPSREKLTAVLADRLGIRPDEILVTNGGDDGIDRCCRAYLAAGRSMVVATPGFEMIERSALLQDAEVRRVEWSDDAFFPAQAVLDAADSTTAVIAIVSPNNPTGCLARTSDVVRIAQEMPGVLVMVDLAYVEFADEDPTLRLRELPNVVVIRTLSKAWGLAGLRVGYCLGESEVIAAIAQAGGPYPVSTLSLELAARALTNAQDAVDAFVERTRFERRQLEEYFASISVKTSKSYGNFVFARVGDGVFCRDACAGLGIAIRAWPERVDLHDAVRITCPSDEEDFARVRAALKTIFEPEAIIFDLDGVIADVSQSYRQAIVQTAASFGVGVTVEDIEAEKARGNANNDWAVTHRMLAERGTNVSLEEVTQRFEAFYQGEEDEPGLWRRESLLTELEWLQALARDWRLAIVTGRPRKDAIRFLEHFEILELFDAIVCMEDAPLKPDPAPVELALDRLNVDRAWMLGDTPDDIRAARGACVLGIGVTAPGEDSETALRHAGAGWVLDHATGLDALLQQTKD